MLELIRSTARNAYDAVRDFVEETIDAVEPEPVPEAAPRAPRSMEVRKAAREQHRNDAVLSARRAGIEAKLEPEEKQIGGRAFLRSLSGMSPANREKAILDQVRAGNIPDFLRDLKEVEIEKDGHVAKVRVMPDYLAIGNDDDFVRVPMTPMTAEVLAEELGMHLPTKKVVDATWEQADVKLQPFGLSKKRESPATFLHHDDIIRAQLGEDAGKLVAGQKKDIVDGRRPGRVAIYGWHEPNGDPIQSLSNVHHEHYVDYSHGVRFMANEVEIDGRMMSVEDVRRDPELSGLLF